ncbi:hypothetical protein AB733_24115 [Photobacterium swingsii]|uniref:Uncharacterized protein n=1 Tax=Photobacterium swingsii TaxID=680026 RepID=A0A0J8V580_9GAMM|nr:mobilome CxxCx(11)CxxC protein [Photobacterium swingsii]KMV28367.1 hypothetical protein AB733_24115 [Photobacterium swingsii]PSW18655.1 hypothetical protein C9I94_24425 [Photobacterium swingsii]
MVENTVETVNLDRNEIKGTIEHMEFLSYGTIQVFERRSNRLKILRAWLTFLGIVLPVTIGGMYLSFGQGDELMGLIVSIAGIVGVIQLILSTWALVSGWDSKYEASIKAVQGNTSIYNRCKRFVSTPPEDDSEFLRLYNQILNDAESQELADLTQHITNAEKNYAYVSALSYYDRACHACNQSPNESIKQRYCSSCGQKKVKENESKSS